MPPPKNSRRATRSILIVCFLAFAALASSCNGRTDEEQPIRVGYIPIAECVQLYVAQEEGFFEREGIDVELVPLQGGALILEALSAGDVDIGFTNVMSLALARSAGADFYSVFGATYETSQNENHAFFIREEAWKGEPRASLQGATIAVNTRSNIEELFVLKYLQSIGLSKDDVTLVEAPFPRMIPMLEAGSIDAASVVEPFITIADGLPQVHRVANHYLAVQPRVLVATYATSAAVANEKHDALTRFVRAMTAANAYIEQNEMRSREIIGANARISDSLLVRIGMPQFETSVDTVYLSSIVRDIAGFGYFGERPVPSASSLVVSLDH